MTLSYRNTQYKELWGQGYPQESIGQQVTEATRTFLVPWEGRFQARLDWLGYSQIIPFFGTLANGSSGTYYWLSRVTPDFHVGYQRTDGYYYLYADNVTFEPFGVPTNTGDFEGEPDYGNESTLDANNEPVYGFAKMTVHYSSRLYKILDDAEMVLHGGAPGGIIDESTLLRYVETPYAVAAQYLTLPDGAIQIANASGTTYDIDHNTTNVNVGPAAGTFGKVEGQWDVTILWRQVPRRMIAAAPVIDPVASLYGIANVKEAAFDYCVGRVNSTTFAGYPPGTLLCEPPEFQQWVQADGQDVYDVTFHFKYFRQGWNYLLQKSKGGAYVYTQVSSDGTYYQEPLTVPPDGAMQYNAYPFQYLFYGYDYSAGYVPPKKTP